MNSMFPFLIFKQDYLNLKKNSFYSQHEHVPIFFKVVKLMRSKKRTRGGRELENIFKQNKKNSKILTVG